MFFSLITLVTANVIAVIGDEKRKNKNKLYNYTHQSRALLIAKKTKKVIKSCLVGYTPVLFLIKININSCSLCVVVTQTVYRLGFYS